MAGLFARIRKFFSAPEIMRASPVIGTMGSAVFDGGWTAEYERNPELVGQKKYITYEERIRNVSIIGAAVRNYLDMVASVDWTVEPADDSEEAKRLAELVDKAMHGMKRPWFRVIRGVALFAFYGNSVHEWVMGLNDENVYVYEDICPRPSKTIERWIVDRGTGQLLGIVQRDPLYGTALLIPRQKLIYVIDDTITDDPRGEGLMRHVMTDVDRLRRYEQLEGYGFETDLRGVPLGRAPLALLKQQVDAGNMTQEEMDKQVKVIEDFVQGHVRTPSLGLTLDSLTYADNGESQVPSNNKQWDLELLKAGSSSLADGARAIERIIRQIARVLKAEHMLLSGGKGSFALGKEVYAAFSKAVDSTLQQIAYCMQFDFLDPLFAWNGWDIKLKPRLVPDALQLDDPVDIATSLQLISQAGAILQPDDPAVNQLRRLLHLMPVPQELMDRAKNQAQERTAGTRGTTQADQQPGAGKKPAIPEADSSKKLIQKRRFLRRGQWYTEYEEAA